MACTSKQKLSKIKLQAKAERIEKMTLINCLPSELIWGKIPQITKGQKQKLAALAQRKMGLNEDEAREIAEKAILEWRKKMKEKEEEYRRQCQEAKDNSRKRFLEGEMIPQLPEKEKAEKIERLKGLWRPLSF